ncbi:oxysterol-binding protein-related protein 1C-like isoform X2 [Rhododendron vialii]|uniref:oxysterol-binding protein-related protein 1C-like isoform X2 n=1 Tax=Rhododendron vialii TaxID=182163 RepID=UPI00265E9EB7|nr:oxysterol-binding protein-related protein 1C-like isoform X2 [Rhododendron vialii]
MHPFCFTASQRDPAVATSSSHSGALAELLNMPHPPSTPSYRSHSATHRRNISSSTTTTRGGGGGSSSSTTAKPANHRLIQRSASESLSRLPSVRINDIVGNGISGILYKWVNYGKGWRPRWFLLQDGVLSYYKIHGPDKIIINQQTEKGCKIIGQDSLRRITRRPHSQPLPFRRKPFGEIHLKVSSIRESRSDDKRFSIYTGTKRLHLRAETREDRGMWMEALQAVKDMFPRMSNSELMAQMGNSVALSTDKLRQRLLEEGVTEAAIQDSEQIMKSEFSALRNHLLLLKQKQLLLLDTMRQLETEKVDLENTVVDESQRQSKDQETSSRLEQDKYSDGSPSESDDDNDIHDAMEEETDDDNNAFFDTRDYLSSSSVRSNGSDIRRSSFDSEDDVDLDSDDGIDSCIRSVGTNHPHVRRRKRLPDPVEKENGVSLWSMIKDNIGKDLTKVCLPVYFNEPISSLQKCFEDLEYSYLLDRAYEWGKMGNSLMRILNVAAFAVSGYSSTDGRNCKPFNPLLGETYEAEYPDKGLRFVSEKVSHHPTIVACHCEGRGWKFWGDSNLKSKFWGRSIQLDPVGVLSLEFDDGEVFQWSKVQGIVQDKNGKKVATLLGKWDESLHYFNGDCSGKGKGSDLSEAHLLWKRSKPSRFPTRYNLTRFAITLNELTPGLKEKLPPTDSRLRPDQRYLENGEYGMANSEKLRLEQRQRQSGKMQERGWKPRWFAKQKGNSDAYCFIGGYWEAKEEGRWESCPDIFGQVPTDIQIF